MILESDCLFDATAIQALSSSLQATSQAFPLIQQRTEDTAITVRAAYDEAHDSRQDALDCREKDLYGLTNLADRVDSSPSSLEMIIATTSDRHSARMNQSKHDFQFAHPQHNDEVVVKFQALIGIIE